MQKCYEFSNLFDYYPNKMFNNYLVSTVSTIQNGHLIYIKLLVTTVLLT